jgi:hypothetical protein
MPNRKLYLSAVFVIESLRKGDRLTGRRIFEGLRSFVSTVQPPITVRHTPVETKEQFFQTLREIADEARLYSHIPILNIEAHCSQQGMQVTSGEFISWSELKDQFTELNAITRLNLLVLMSACEGAHLVSIVQPTDRSPVAGIIGPNRVVSDVEVETAGLAFYKKLFEAGDAIAAWRAMNDAVDPNTRTFSLFPAEHFFREVYRRFTAAKCTEEALTEREENFVAKLSTDLPGEEVQRQRERFRFFIRDHRPRFEEYKSHFFFCDIYPENRERFSISFEDCTKVT